MGSFPFTYADLGAILVILISAFFAFTRGFVRESLSVGAWIGALFAALFAFSRARPIARNLIEIPQLADIAAFVSVFLVALMLLTVVARLIAGRVQHSRLNAVDRSLGFVYGLARGVVLVCLAYIPVQLLLAPTEQPVWLREARSFPLIERGADWITTLVSSNLRRSTASSVGGFDREEVRKALESERLARDIMTPEPRAPAAPGEAKPKGYGERDRRDLERLLDSGR
jgi:membrane protein required for colicin V production